MKLRFAAELNQLESIQQIEQQLNQMGSIRDVAAANMDAAKMAEKIRVKANKLYKVKSDILTPSILL